jgi:hypothetical protein
LTTPNDLPGNGAPREGTEGVIRFRHELRPPVPGDVPPLECFRSARDRARALGVVGRDPERYQGLAFGNLSLREGTGFWITASQRIDAGVLEADDLIRVTSVTAEGTVLCRGRRPPSSETLTHAAVQDAAPPGPLAVLHGHAPDLWRNPPPDWPSSPPSAANGTIALATAVHEAVSRHPEVGWLVMHGHEDGILAWSTDFDRLLQQLTRALDF